MLFYYVMLFLCLVAWCAIVAGIVTLVYFGVRWAWMRWAFKSTAWHHALLMLVLSLVSLFIGATSSLVLFGGAE